MKQIIPKICIFFNVKSAIVLNIQYGIEEENLFFNSIEKKDENNLIELTYRATYYSTLGIGIGVTKGSAMLNLQNMVKDKPLFYIKQCSLENARILGINAARIAKRVALRPFINETYEIFQLCYEI
jgi:hypothetical protein